MSVHTHTQSEVHIRKAYMQLSIGSGERNEFVIIHICTVFVNTVNLYTRLIQMLPNGKSPCSSRSQRCANGPLEVNLLPLLQLLLPVASNAAACYCCGCQDFLVRRWKRCLAPAGAAAHAAVARKSAAADWCHPLWPQQQPQRL